MSDKLLSDEEALDVLTSSTMCGFNECTNNR